MASKSLGTLTIDLVAKIGGFTKGMTEAERATAKSARAIEKRAQRMAKGLDAAFKAAAAAFLALGVGAAVGIGRAVDRMDEIGKASQKVGVGTEALSKLAYAAELADVNFESLQGGLIKLAKAQDSANQGTGAQLDLFRALGVEFKNADGTLRNTAEVFIDLADKFRVLPDGADKTTAALTLLGKSGANLIPLMNGGGQAIKDAGDELDRFGGVVTPEAAAQAEIFNDNVTRLKTAMSGLWQSLAQDVLPGLVEFSENTLDATTNGEGLKTVLDAVTHLVRGFGLTAQLAVDGVQALTFQALGLYNVLNGLSKLNISFLWRGGPGADFEAAREAFGAAGESGRETRENLFGGGAAPEFDWDVSEQEAQRYAAQAKIEVEAAKNAEDLAAALKKQREAAAAAAAANAANAEANRLAAEAAREQEKADEDLAKRLEELTKAGIDYRASLDTLEAQLAGPLAEAVLEHEREMQEVQRLYDEGAIGIEDVTRAQLLHGEALAKTRDELDPYGESLRLLLEDMDFELDLLGKSNAERATELELRRLGIDLATKEGALAAKAIQERADAIEQMHEQIDALDDFRNSFEDNVAGVLDGSKSIKEAMRDMVDDFIAQLARMAAQKFSASLFGEQGSSGGGIFGDLLGSLLGAFSGGGGGSGLAGIASGSSPYKGIAPGKDMAVTAGYNGQVVPAGKGSMNRPGPMRGGDTIINVQGSVTRRALSRIEIDRNRRQQRETARTG